MTNVVLDANFCLALVLPLPYSENVTRCMNGWLSEMPQLLAPSLWEYEVVTGIRRASVLGLLDSGQAEAALDELLKMGLDIAPASADRHHRALSWAKRLNQARAYDGQYLALAEQFGAEFWTADQRLANGAKNMQVNWVHWVGEV